MSDLADKIRELSDLLAARTIRYSRDHGEPNPSKAFPIEVVFSMKEWEQISAVLLDLEGSREVVLGLVGDAQTCHFHGDKPKEFCGQCARELAEPYQLAIQRGGLIALENVLELIEIRDVTFGKKVYFAGFSVQSNSRAAQSVKRAKMLKEEIMKRLRPEPPPSAR